MRARGCVAGCVITLVAGLLLIAAAAPAAAVTWLQQPAPAPAISNGQLSSVACPSAASCEAVGSYFNQGDLFMPSAEGWNGTTWSVQAMPAPAGATYVQLYGVSCSAASACTAVGFSMDSNAIDSSLIERWNGTSWTLQTLSGGSQLQGVSCASATTCTAVGYINSSGTLIPTLAVWNGTSWSVKSVPTPAGSIGSQLFGVSCVSTTDCTAAGSWGSPGAVNHGLVEHWNGAGLAIEATPTPSGSTNTYLSAISCTATNACTAVGKYAVGSFYPLVERWNGSTWSMQPTPYPSQGTGFSLQGVSCASATSCTAVGDYTTSAGPLQMLAEQWSGSSWSVTTPQLPSGVGNDLSGVSCSSAGACTAVGSNYLTRFTQTTIAESWSGSGWSLRPTPDPVGAIGAGLTAVSCSSAIACTAVGWFTNAAEQYVPLAERWNGTGWTIQRPPSPADATGTVVFNGVSCPSSTSCTAAGWYISGWNTDSLAEHWNGTSWSVQTTPNPSGATTTTLAAVSCPTTTTCAAVGPYRNGPAVAEQWGGTSWALEPTPNPSAGPLTGVSCTSAGNCEAVGYAANTSAGGQLTLAERWNGSSWTTQTTPNQTGATFNYLIAVTCPAATACEAVGDSSGAYSSTLAERWNGSSWSLQASPKPARYYSNAFDSVSCASSTACVAIGVYGSSYGSEPLGASWNGSSWSVEDPASPFGAQLNGVACPSTSVCFAVGGYTSGQASVPLIEKRS